MKKLKSFPTKMKRTHHISTASALFVNLRSRGFFIFVVTAFGYPKRQKNWKFRRQPALSLRIWLPLKFSRNTASPCSLAPLARRLVFYGRVINVCTVQSELADASVGVSLGRWWNSQLPGEQKIESLQFWLSLTGMDLVKWKTKAVCFSVYWKKSMSIPIRLVHFSDVISSVANLREN